MRVCPGSLGTGGGDHPPSVWPYDTSSLSAAQRWCCHHDDCGGVTHQNGRFEVRSGSFPIPHFGDGESSFPREGAGGGVNMTNVTRCVVQAEMDFTQSTATKYATVATPHKTRELSQQLVKRYGVYVR